MNLICENMSCKIKEGKYRDEIFALEDDIRDKDHFTKKVVIQRNTYFEEINILKKNLSDITKKNEDLMENVEQLLKDVNEAQEKERVLRIELEDIKKNNIKANEIEKEPNEVKRKLNFVQTKFDNDLKKIPDLKETKIKYLENKLLEREDKLEEIKAERNQLKQKCNDLVDELESKAMEIEILEEKINKNESNKTLEISLGEELEISLSNELENSFCEEDESYSNEEPKSSPKIELETSCKEQESYSNKSLSEEVVSSFNKSLKDGLEISSSEELELDNSLIDLSLEDIKQANLYKCKCCEKSYETAEEFRKHMRDIGEIKAGKRKNKFEPFEDKVPEKRIKISASESSFQKKEFDKSRNCMCDGIHKNKHNCTKREDLRKRKLRNHILKQHTVLGQFVSFLENFRF